MRATNTFQGLSFVKERIGTGQTEPSCVLVHRIVQRHGIQVRQSQQAWDIGIVHQVIIAIAIYFQGIDLSELRVLISGMFF
ncbi:hypothetical protein D3C87_1750900 [compost metagenome]